MEAVQILLGGVFAELRHAAADELRPDGVLFEGIGAPVLLDEIGLSDRNSHGGDMHAGRGGCDWVHREHLWQNV